MFLESKVQYLEAELEAKGKALLEQSKVWGEGKCGRIRGKAKGRVLLDQSKMCMWGKCGVEGWCGWGDEGYLCGPSPPSL